MAEVTTARTYPRGVTSWIDVSAPDPDAAEAFYGEVLGWAFETMTPPGVPRYAVGRLDGQDAGGLAEVDGPGVWSTYIAVDDIVAATAGIVDAGGALLDPPQAAGEGGWSAICADPAGVEFRLWQAKNRPGVQALNRPGAWNFSDLHTDDPAGAAFYEQVFGWVVDRSNGMTFLKVPGYGDHLAATVDPDIHERQASAPPGFADVIGGVARPDRGLAPHWHVTFAVADRDEAVATAKGAGGIVLVTADDQWTRKATVVDPQGAIFTLSQFTPP